MQGDIKLTLGQIESNIEQLRKLEKLGILVGTEVTFGGNLWATIILSVILVISHYQVMAAIFSVFGCHAMADNVLKIDPNLVVFSFCFKSPCWMVASCQPFQ